MDGANLLGPHLLLLFPVAAGCLHVQDQDLEHHPSEPRGRGVETRSEPRSLEGPEAEYWTVFSMEGSFLKKSSIRPPQTISLVCCGGVDFSLWLMAIDFYLDQGIYV